MTPTLSINGSELWAVPAMHNRSVFAEPVNRLCRDAATRPEAIAVELSPDAVAAVVAWFRELKVGTSEARPLPCMLGLAKANHRIHPRHRQAALRLQERHGKLLPEITPAILHRELGYAPVALLCLSATDSIIEAIRCAVGLDIPVYGVDLGDVADGERGNTLLQDTTLAQDDLARYVERNAPFCAAHGDTVVDERREQIMSARLKCLLRQYRRVLFTCGIGHWHNLSRRLLDPAQPTAKEPGTLGREQFCRVLVSPPLALAQMDLFPELTVRYEALRKLPLADPERRLDYVAFSRAKLLAAFECAEPNNREAVSELAQFLSNLCLVSQQRVPDLFTTLHAAQMMVSPSYATRLAELLVYQGIEWAKPEDWPNLPYLRGTPNHPDPSSSPEDGPQAELEHQGRRSRSFYLSHRGTGERPPAGALLPLPPERKPANLNQQGAMNAWVWPPCESLLYGTAYAAADLADQSKRERSPEPFSGSLQDGVDVKATLRAEIRGEKVIQVRVAAPRKPKLVLSEEGDDPTVFLFEREADAQNASWHTFSAGDAGDIRRFVRNPAEFDQVTGRKGQSFVVNVSYSTSRVPPEHLRSHISDSRYLYGCVIFGSPSLCPMQSARWLEECRYTCCPIVPYACMHTLSELYRREHQLSLDPTSWFTRLIRLALPYAKRRVVVLMASPQPLPTVVLREASARRVDLECVPLSQFPAERIELMRQQYLVYPRDVHKLDFPEAMQEAFGQSPRQYLNLLPERVQAQLNLET